MKRFIIIMAIIALMIPCFGVCAAETDEMQTDLSVDFDMSSSCLFISGVIENVEGILCTLNIAPYSENPEPFSESNPPYVTRIFTTRADGAVSEKFPIAESLPSGKYTAYIHYNSKKVEKYFNLVNVSDTATQEILRRLNSASSAAEFKTILTESDNAIKVGIDIEAISEHFNMVAEVACSLKPDGGYTVASLAQSVENGIAADIVKTKGINAAAEAGYEKIMGISAAEFEKMDESVKTKTEEYLLNADYSQKSLNKIIEDCIICAKLYNAADRSGIKDVLLSNSEIFGITTGSGSDYEKISSTNKYKVFDYVKTILDNNKNVTDVNNYINIAKTAFNNGVNDVLKSSSSGGQSGGGVGGSSTGSTSSVSSNINMLNPNTLAGTADKDKYSDISGHFAAEYIERLSDNGIISGYPDGSFKPDAFVTRAEFSKMITLAFSINSTGAARFTDVKNSDWYAEYVNKLASAEIIKGYNGVFSPDNNISRQDAALILYRVILMNDITLEGKDVNFADFSSISDYAGEAVTVMASNEILRGDGTNFYPLNNITRGETAVMICRVYDICGGGK